MWVLSCIGKTHLYDCMCEWDLWLENPLSAYIEWKKCYVSSALNVYFRVHFATGRFKGDISCLEMIANKIILDVTEKFGLIYLYSRKYIVYLYYLLYIYISVPSMDVTRTEVTWPLLYSVTQRDMFVLWKYKKCWYILEQVVQFIKIDVHVSFLFKDKISWPINF